MIYGSGLLLPVLSTVFHEEVTSPGPVPMWAGVVALSVVVLLFGVLLWWLFFSPLVGRVAPAPPSPRAVRTRRILAALMLMSGVLLTVGARWDELWHRIYGGFGEDFLWPPHLLMYVSLGLNGVFAAGGLLIALRGRGGLRERFRAEPLLGLLGLLSAFQMASIPSDLIWHQIIGPDISAWSLPHVLMAVTISAASLTGVAIALSTLPRARWALLWQRPAGVELAAIGIVALAVLFLLQMGTTEWEWVTQGIDHHVLERGYWVYPAVTLVIGMFSAHIALYATRRAGAATAVALLVFAVQAITVTIYRAAAPPGPILAAHLLILPPALAVDAWYAARRDEGGQPATLWGGIAIYWAVFSAVAFPYLAIILPEIGIMGAGFAVTAVVCAVLAAATGFVFSHVGEWLGSLGERPAPAAQAESARSVLGASAEVQG